MKKLQVGLIAQCWIVLCALLLAGGAARVDAQTPGPHPDYLHAIRNLREARALLHYNYSQSKHQTAAAAAVPEIDLAINDLKSASHLDDKSLGDVPPFKTMPDEGKFHQVQSLLDAAHHDVKLPESDPAARPYKDHALEHIDNARAAIAPAL